MAESTGWEEPTFAGSHETALGALLRAWTPASPGESSGLRHAWSSSFASPRAARADVRYRRVTRELPVRRRLDPSVALVQDRLDPALNRLLPRSVVVADPVAVEALRTRYPEVVPGACLRWYDADELDDPEAMRDAGAFLAEASGTDDGVALGIGGGRVMDLVKFLGHRADADVVALPTSLATHVYASPKTHALPVVRAFGHTRTLDGRAPETALLDLPFLESVGQAEARLLRAGFGDLLAFLTAPRDWTLAAERGRAETDSFVLAFIDHIVETLSELDPTEPFARWVEPYTLAQVCLCHLTDWVGSAPASGSEHLFAHGAERTASPTGLHGELVALGALAFAPLLGVDVHRARSLMARFTLPRSLAAVGMDPETAAAAVMDGLREGREKERFTVLEARTLDQGWTEARWRDYFVELGETGVLDD